MQRGGNVRFYLGGLPILLELFVRRSVFASLVEAVARVDEDVQGNVPDVVVIEMMVVHALHGGRRGYRASEFCRER